MISDAGVVMAKFTLAEDSMLMVREAVTLTFPFESSHSALTITEPAAVGVNLIEGVAPVTPVEALDSDSVAAPVESDPIEKRMTCPLTRS